MNSDEQMKYQGRLLLFYALLVLMIGTLLGAVGYRQLVESDAFNEKVKVQNHRRIVTPAPRGHIFDREGKLLVANKSKFSAVVFLSDSGVRSAFRAEYRALVRDHREREESYDTGHLQKLARANVIQSYLDGVNAMLERDTQVDPEKVTAHLNFNPLLPFPLIEDLSRDEFAVLLESLPIESPVQVYVSNMRHYPYEATASQTLGFVVSTFLTPDPTMPGVDLRTFAEKGTFGRTGVERQFDEQLQGQMGVEIWVVDPYGFQVESIERRYPVKGQDVQLSLDIDLQLAAERAFVSEDGVEQVGALVALDAENLEVLAMVSKPDFDLNETTPFIGNETYKRINDAGGWQNRALQGVYPPGSPFKLLTAIAALKSGTVTPSEIHNCPGFIRQGGALKYCHLRTGHGDRDLMGAIRDSCNVYFYEEGLEVGIDRISSEAIYMGLDGPTGINLPHETRSMLVPTREWKQRRFKEPWYPGDTTNLSIGQGFLRLTPLQLAVFTASVASNQVLSQPSILKLTPEQIAARPPAKPLGLTPQDHAVIVEGMAQAAVLGTARRANIPGIPIGAKTGTAEVDQDGGKIELAWIVVYAPIKNPKIVVAVMLEGQVLNQNWSGGLYAAPIAKAVMEEFFRKRPDLVPPPPPEPTATEDVAQP